MIKKPSRAMRRAYAVNECGDESFDSWPLLFRDLGIAIIIGAVVWVFISSLIFFVHKSQHFLFTGFQHHSLSTNTAWLNFNSMPQLPILILLGALIFSGILRALLLHFKPIWQDAANDGVAISIKHFLHSHDDEKNAKQTLKRYQSDTFMQAIRRWVMTFFTLGPGGSGGLEGPSLPLGESVGAGFCKWFNIQNGYELRTFQMAGIAAAISTLCHTPFTAALFAAEIVYVDRIVSRMLLYSLLAAITAHQLNANFINSSPIFVSAQHTSLYSLYEYLLVAVIAIIISAPAALCMKKIFVAIDNLVKPLPFSLRVIVGSLGLVLLTIIFWHFLNIGPELFLGSGEHTINLLLGSTVEQPILRLAWVLLLLLFAKLIATGLTVMTGGSAGLLFPAMFIGSVSGACIYQFLSDYGLFWQIETPDLFIISGIVAGLVSMVEVPLAAIALAIEVFGASYALPAIIACIVSHTLSKRLNLK